MHCDVNNFVLYMSVERGQAFTVPNDNCEDKFEYHLVRAMLHRFVLFDGYNEDGI